MPIDYFNLGDWATSSGFRIAVTNAEKMAQYHPVEGAINAPPHTFFIIVNIAVINLGSSTIATQANLFNIRDKSGHIYQPVKLSILVSNRFPWDVQALAPGEAVSGRILYIVSNLSSQMSMVTFANGQYLAWVLPW